MYSGETRWRSFWSWSNTSRVPGRVTHIQWAVLRYGANFYCRIANKLVYSCTEVLKVKRSRLANLPSVASTAWQGWHASFDLLPPFLPLPPLVRTLRKLFSCGKRGIKEVYWVRGGEGKARKCERGVSNCLIPNFLPEILHRYAL